MLQQLSVKTRLRLAFAGIMSLLVAAAGVGYWGIESMDQFLLDALHGDIALAQESASMRSGVFELRRYEKDVFINVSAIGKVQEYEQKWQAGLGRLRDSVARAKSLARTDNASHLQALKVSLDAYAAGFVQVLDKIKRGTVTTAAQANNEFDPFKDAVRETERLADEINDSAVKRTGTVEGLSERRHATVLTWLIGLTVAGLVCAILMAAMITRLITQSLHRATTVAATVADGRLGNGIHVERNDEFGKLLLSLKTMDDKLYAIVGDLVTSAEKIDVATREIAAGNDDLSARTQEQASSLEQTAASIEEMTASVQQNATHASEANQLAEGAFAVAERGGAVVKHVVDAMSEIRDSSSRIGNIVSVIDGIAFQTNLLALNAAVEAARAGEQGRGFAVVASEVRNLAQRSATAAKEIKALIDDSGDKVKAGADLAENAGRALDEIVVSVQKVSAVVNSIAAANEQQSSGIHQINHAIAQLDAMTQRNAAAVEEVAAVSKALQDQASLLTSKAAQFTLSGSSASMRSAQGTTDMASSTEQRHAA